MVDEIITVSVRLDSLEQTLNPLLNPYHGLRRFAVPSHSTVRPRLHFDPHFIWKMFPTYYPVDSCCAELRIAQRDNCVFYARFYVHIP